MNSKSFVARGELAAFMKRLLSVFAVALVVASIGAGVAHAKKEAPAKSAVVEGVVNLNTATEKQLTLLPRIGPSKAAKIIAYRTKRPFQRVIHLARVKGIGLKTVRRLKPYLTLSGATTLKRPVRITPKK